MKDFKKFIADFIDKNEACKNCKYKHYGVDNCIHCNFGIGCIQLVGKRTEFKSEAQQ